MSNVRSVISPAETTSERCKLDEKAPQVRFAGTLKVCMSSERPAAGGENETFEAADKVVRPVGEFGPANAARAAACLAATAAGAGSSPFAEALPLFAFELEFALEPFDGNEGSPGCQVG